MTEKEIDALRLALEQMTLDELYELRWRLNKELDALTDEEFSATYQLNKQTAVAATRKQSERRPTLLRGSRTGQQGRCGRVAHG